jgi:putative nucleotidyltransferase with HDIG domain
VNKYFAKKDFYDNKGTLLLAKGKEITNDIILKLVKLQKADNFEDGIVNSKFEENIDINIVDSTYKLTIKYNLNDDILTTHIVKILNDIIFNSKNKSWSVYISTLSNYVDWIYSHSINVALLSLILAVKFDYSDEQMTYLALGALLHDIGKVLIPKKLIMSANTVSNEEMELIKKHCELGSYLVDNLNLPKECTDIILQHHERLDGSGYPFGLKNEKISFNAKIVMVVDSIDAMTSYRPYKTSKDLNQAYDELMNLNTYCKDVLLALKPFISSSN